MLLASELSSKRIRFFELFTLTPPMELLHCDWLNEEELSLRVSCSDSGSASIPVRAVICSKTCWLNIYISANAAYISTACWYDWLPMFSNIRLIFGVRSDRRSSSVS